MTKYLLTLCALLPILLALQVLVSGQEHSRPELCCSQGGWCGFGEKYCGAGCLRGPCINKKNVQLIAMVSDPRPNQNCGCPPNLCCSKWGYCGLGEDYCGPGCQEGPCDEPPPTPPEGDGVVVADVVTDAFFNGIINQSSPRCAGRGFYTRDTFIKALESALKFGTVGSVEIATQEIAAFFAHVTHETDHMCYIEEKGGPTQPVGAYCKASPQWPCAPGKRYFGRGPLQLSWNYNYIDAGNSLNFDGLNNPDLVAEDPLLAFQTSLWFWMKYCHTAFVTGQGFGATIRAINGALECDGKNPATVTARVNYYTTYCTQLKVDPGDNLWC